VDLCAVCSEIAGKEDVKSVDSAKFGHLEGVGGKEQVSTKIDYLVSLVEWLVATQDRPHQSKRSQGSCRAYWHDPFVQCKAHLSLLRTS
jgi:hypothetical protein